MAGVCRENKDPGKGCGFHVEVLVHASCAWQRAIATDRLVLLDAGTQES